MRLYLLRIVCICFVFALCRSLLEKGSPGQKLLQLAFGMLFTFTVIRPILRPGAFTFAMPELRFDEYADAGQVIYESNLRLSIISRTEAYILDKAASLGMSPEISVTLTEDSPYIPKSVAMSGDYDPEIRQKLAEILITTLGLSEENIQWTNCDAS